MSKPQVEFRYRKPAKLLHRIIVVNTFALITVAGYFLLQSWHPLTRSQAAGVVATILESQGPTSVTFRTGLVKDRPDGIPSDPQYRLLESAGILRVVQVDKSSARVSLTAYGQEVLKTIPGVKQSRGSDDSETYVVPLAVMQLDNIRSITTGRRYALVNFSWRWRPNKLGESFDVSGMRMRELKGKERWEMLEEHGARSYRQQPTNVTVALVKTPDGWQLER